MPMYTRSLFRKPDLYILGIPRNRWSYSMSICAVLHHLVPVIAETALNALLPNRQWMRLQVLEILRIQLQCLLPLHSSLPCTRQRSAWVREENHLFKYTGESGYRLIRFLYTWPTAPYQQRT